MKNDLVKKVVSLSNSELRKENERLRKNIKLLILSARENYNAEESIDQIQDEVCATGSIEELVKVIILKGKSVFGLSVVTITFLNSLKDAFKESYFESHPKFNKERSFIKFSDIDQIRARKVTSPKPILRGSIKGGDPTFFFRGISRAIRSEAIIPIYISDKLQAVVAMGSSSVDRFHEEHGLKFIKSYARLISMKLELLLKEQG